MSQGRLFHRVAFNIKQSLLCKLLHELWQLDGFGRCVTGTANTHLNIPIPSRILRINLLQNKRMNLFDVSFRNFGVVERQLFHENDGVSVIDGLQMILH